MYHKRGILDLQDKSPCKILHAADRRRRRLLRTKTAPQSVWRPQPRPRWDALSAVRHAPRCATSLGSGRVYAGRAGQPAGRGGLSGAAGLATLPEHPIHRRGGAAARGVGGARRSAARSFASLPCASWAVSGWSFERTGRIWVCRACPQSLSQAFVLRFTGQRKGTPGIFSTHSRLRKEPVKMRMLDYAERNGYIKGVVTDIVHESGRGAPLAITKFRNPYKYKMDKHRLIAAEGTYTGQFIYAGKKCEWTMHARSACSAADVAALAASLGRGSLGSSGRWRWAAAGLGSQQVMRS